MCLLMYVLLLNYILMINNIVFLFKYHDIC